VEAHGPATGDLETITDDRLIEALSALGRRIEPVPRSVRADARAVFRPRDPAVGEVFGAVAAQALARGPVGVG